MKKIMMIAMALVFGSSSGQAAEVANVSGVGKGKSQTKIEVVSEGHMLMNSVTTYESFAADDPASPFNGMKGECWGAIEIKAPSASGQGNCVFVDSAGDKNYNAWVATGLAKDGALKGTWSVLGGTGKYKDASGGGKFQSLTNREAGTFVNTVDGAIVLN